MNKPVVQYTPSRYESIAVGSGACVVPVDHPDTWEVINGEPVHTSIVISMDNETGQFETLNTIYVRAGQ